MKSRVNPTATANWNRDWKVGVRVWFEREGQAVLGAGRAELLAAIDTEHSITKAAKSAGMSYRKAWTMIQEVNAAAGEPLVEAAVGGKQGGGASLTPKGRAAIEVYEAVRRSLTESAADALQRSLSTDAKNASCIHLAAAISLQEAVGQILTEFAVREPLLRVRAIFGASNELTDQVRAGSPADIFLSADEAALDRLEDVDLLLTKSRRANCQERVGDYFARELGPDKKPERATRFTVQTAGVGRAGLSARPVCAGLFEAGADIRRSFKEDTIRRQFASGFGGGRFRHCGRRRSVRQRRHRPRKLETRTTRADVASRDHLYSGADSTRKMPGWRRTVARFSYVPNGESLLPKVRTRNSRCCQSSSLMPS